MEEATVIAGVDEMPFFTIPAEFWLLCDTVVASKNTLRVLTCLERSIKSLKNNDLAANNDLLRFDLGKSIIYLEDKPLSPDTVSFFNHLALSESV